MSPDAATTADFSAASDADDRDTLDRLLDADPTLAAARDDDGVSAVMHALYRGHRITAEDIAADLPSLDIFEAAALGRADEVRALLDADPGLATARSADGFTALHFPAFFGGADAAQALIDAGADVNVRSANDFAVMPIHSAAAGRHDDDVAVLIAAGADVNVRQRHGWAPLHGAAQNGDRTMLDRLLAAGADPGARNEDGRSAADLADDAGHVELGGWLRDAVAMGPG
jgi:ankyrin repeat protein